jgi:hypothetical protein
MISIQRFAIGLLAVALITGASYIQGRKDGNAIAGAERATMEEIARVAREESAAAAAAAIANISVTHTTIRHRAEVITREKPVYRDCINDPGVERLLDAARANQPAPAASDSGVPGAGDGASQDIR